VLRPLLAGICLKAFTTGQFQVHGKLLALSLP
jgi:hypothetical protein